MLPSVRSLSFQEDRLEFRRYTELVELVLGLFYYT